MQKLEALEYLAVWLAPEHMAQTAKFVMDGHRLSILAVVKGDAVLGFVDRDAVAIAAPTDSLSSLIKPFHATLSADTGFREAASLFAREDLAAAPVVRDGAFLGIVTSNMLLKELSRSWDPLTGLSWSDLLREWGAGHLRAGIEICILSFDIVGMGALNQSAGHPAGDAAIRALGSLLADGISHETDLLVRSGGSRFLIGTTRTLSEASSLKDVLLGGASDQVSRAAHAAIQVQAGLVGGRRTHERVTVHPEANVDDLITLALNAAGSGASPHEPMSVGQGSPIELLEIRQGGEPGRLFTARIQSEGRTFTGEGGSAGQSASIAAAEAVIDALGRALPETGFDVDEVAVFVDPSGRWEANAALYAARGKSRQRITGRAAAASAVEAAAQSILRAVETLGLKVP